MPTYQYACTVCGHQLEAVQAFTDDALTQCPECEGRLRKLFSGVGVVFKGSGFYRTDSRSSANGSKSDDSASKGSTSGSGGTDAAGAKPDSPAKSEGAAKPSAKPAASTKAAD